MGWHGSRIGSIWHDMKTRCNNQRYDKYHRYGGRGISVCDEWANSFEVFRKWATENGYSDDLTLDRIDNNGNYCPDNCKWVTKKEQMNNRSTNRMLTYNGKTQSVTQWAEELNIAPTTIFRRLERGWDADKTLSEPIHKTSVEREIEYKGKTMRLYEWAEELGIKYKTLHARLAKGWSVEKAFTTPT